MMLLQLFPSSDGVYKIESVTGGIVVPIRRGSLSSAGESASKMKNPQRMLDGRNGRLLVVYCGVRLILPVRVRTLVCTLSYGGISTSVQSNARFTQLNRIA
jgi:hypothetical protein